MENRVNGAIRNSQTAIFIVLQTALPICVADGYRISDSLLDRWRLAS